MAECGKCKGSGVCIYCKGTRKIGNTDCPPCNGTGQCNICHGRGQTR